eukprot:g8337.t1
MSLPEYGPHLPTSLSHWRQQRSTFVPSGFECVAHPVFFQLSAPPSSAAAPSAASATAERRPLAATSTPTTTINQTTAAAWDVGNLGKGGSFGADDLRSAAEGSTGVGGSERGGEREVDAVCPICLGKFERPVTLTSCLHSFCHTCILGWYEHTVAVALSQGDLSAFHPERGAPISSTINGAGSSSGSGSSSSSSGSSNNNGTGGSPRPAPYRCPLCQVPGPFFLSVEPATAGNKSSKKKNAGDSKSKLKFRLLGARTVLGGGGPTSGGVKVDEHSGGVRKARDGGGTGYPSPTMSQLRAAVRTQLALAAAAQGSGAGAGAETATTHGSRPPAVGQKREGAAGGEAEAGGDSSSAGSSPHPAGSDRDGGTRRPAGGGGASSSSSSSGSHDDRATGGDEGGEHESPIPSRRKRGHSRWQDNVHLDLDLQSRGAASGNAGSGFRRRLSGDGEGTLHNSRIFSDASRPEGRSGGSHAIHHANGARYGRNRRDDGYREGRGKRRSGDRAAGGRRSRGGVLSLGGSSSGATASSTGGRLPWEPGALVAEDGLAFIEAMLEREKKRLRRTTTGAGDST